MTEKFFVGDLVVPLEHKDVHVELGESFDLSYTYGIQLGVVARVVEIEEEDIRLGQVCRICHYFLKEDGEEQFASGQACLPSLCLRSATDLEKETFLKYHTFVGTEGWADFCTFTYRQGAKGIHANLQNNLAKQWAEFPYNLWNDQVPAAPAAPAAPAPPTLPTVVCNSK